MEVKTEEENESEKYVEFEKSLGVDAIVFAVLDLEDEPTFVEGAAEKGQVPVDVESVRCAQFDVDVANVPGQLHRALLVARIQLGEGRLLETSARYRSSYARSFAEVQTFRRDGTAFATQAVISTGYYKRKRPAIH